MAATPHEKIIIKRRSKDSAEAVGFIEIKTVITNAWSIKSEDEISLFVGITA